jgi:serine/threonine-protein kinase
MATGDLAEIGKYRIVGQIGEGAMGIVYRGVDPVLNRPVAIKVMSDAVARDKDLRARFVREAQSAGSLQHPNVVTVYDFGEVDGHPFIAMELVEGADLDELLRQNAPLTLVEKIDVLIDVLNGLSYAHKRGIVHRDIKPANIRIDEEGRARIMDFGIAHLNSSTGTRMTRTGMMVGTPAYMSPEQITGVPITAASDIFSIGAVMYELLAGVTAFQADTLQSIMYQIVTVPAPEITQIVPSPQGPDGPAIVKALDAIAARALEKEAADRFESALEMATALSDVRARLVQGKTIAGPASLRASVAKAMAAVPEPSKRPARRTLVVAAGVAAVAVVAVVLMFNRHDKSSGVTTTPLTPAPQPVASSPATSSASPPGASGAVPATPPSMSASTSGSPSTAAQGRTSSTEPSAREFALIRDLQATALDARRRAADAGASDAALDSGDAHNRVASSLLADGKASEAGAQLRQATAAWMSSERAARMAAASPPARQTERPPNTPPVTAAPATSVAQQSSPPPAATPVTTPATQSPPAPVPAAPATSSTAPAANPVTEVASVVATYARALESRDVSMVRRAYPGMTASQTKAWEQFFSSLRSLRVTLAVSGLDVSGASADGKVVGTYDYVTDMGKTIQQPVSFRATFRRDAGVWQLASVH